jgi:hypothetical protein
MGLSMGYRIIIALVLLFAGLYASAANAQASFPGAYGQGSSAAEASHTAKTAAGTLFSFHTDTGSAAVWVMVLDGTAVPSSPTTLSGCVNATTARPCLLSRYQFPANNSYSVDWDVTPLRFTTGLILLCSSTGPFLWTTTNTCIFSNIQVQ